MDKITHTAASREHKIHHKPLLEISVCERSQRFFTTDAVNL